MASGSIGTMGIILLLFSPRAAPPSCWDVSHRVRTSFPRQSRFRLGRSPWGCQQARHRDGLQELLPHHNAVRYFSGVISPLPVPPNLHFYLCRNGVL